MLIRLLTGDFVNVSFVPALSRNFDVFRLENGRYLVRGKLQIDGLTYAALCGILSVYTVNSLNGCGLELTNKMGT